MAGIGQDDIPQCLACLAVYTPVIFEEARAFAPPGRPRDAFVPENAVKAIVAILAFTAWPNPVNASPKIPATGAFGAAVLEIATARRPLSPWFTLR